MSIVTAAFASALLALAASGAAAQRSRTTTGPWRWSWAWIAAAAAVSAVCTPLLAVASTAAAPWATAVGSVAAAGVGLSMMLLVLGMVALTAPHQTRATLLRDCLDSTLISTALLAVLWLVAVTPVLDEITEVQLWQLGAVLLVTSSPATTAAHAFVRAPAHARHRPLTSAGMVVVVLGVVLASVALVTGGSGTWAAATLVPGWALVLAGALLHRRDDHGAELPGLRSGNGLAHTGAVVTVLVTAWQTGRTGGALDPVTFWLSTLALGAVATRTLLDLRRTGRLQRQLELRVADRTRELADSRHRFAALVAHSSDLVLVVDAGGLVTYASPSAEELLGACVPDGREPRAAADLLVADGPGVPTDVFAQVAASRAPHLELRLALRGADGQRVDVEARVTNLLGDADVRGLVVNARDVTRALELERELSRQAFGDALTGLPNRALFRDRLEHALRRRASRSAVKLFYLDLDGFKAVNDTLGHGAGDELLVAVAERLRAVVRDGDTVARLGGDEFAVLLEEEADTAAAEHLAQRICDVVRVPVQLRGSEVHVAASVGVASTRTAGTDPEDLVRAADLAMYEAKSAGRGGYAVYAPHMHEALVERVQLEADLRRAVEQGQFRVVYQPLVDMGGGGVSGVEALVRWHHPERGVIAPAAFIPLAESTGLIDLIGTFVLAEACQQVATWRAEVPGAEDVRLSVNLSGHQLADPLLVTRVGEVLAATGLPATSLVLEITESVLVTQSESALRTLNALRALGIRLAIDDFGTGYSSLSYLHRLPVDILKIDKSFVDRLSESGDLSLVEAILSMAATLSLTTVAEGIEHEHQLTALAAQGCHTGQGYHFSPPVAPELLPELLVAALPGRAGLPPDPAPVPASVPASVPAPGPALEPVASAEV